MMLELLLGAVLLLVWIVLQFIVDVHAGIIHVALALGVILIIRGIAVSRWGTPDA